MTSMVLPELGVPLAQTGTIVLVQQPGNGDNGGQGADFGKSSPVGLLILILFLIAVALLVRSMNKHLKRIPESFDNGESRLEESADGNPEPGDRANPR